MRDLCLAGGVALNCVGNGRILREGPFEQIWIQPAAGDAGGALGVALSLWHRYLEQAARQRRGGGHVGTAVARSAAAPRRRAYADGMKRLVSSGRASATTRSRAFLDANGYAARRVEPRGARRRGRGAARRGEGRRPAAGPHGVRPARARRPLDHRRRALAEDAVGDEPEDQVPRIVPAVRAVGAARARRATGSSSTATARTCCSSPTCSATRRLPVPPDAEALWGIEKLNVPRSTIPASRTSTTRRASRPCAARRTRSTTTSSTAFHRAHRLPGDRQHVVQRARRADRLHAGGRLPLLHAHRHGRAGARELHPRKRPTQPKRDEDESWKKEFVLD